LLSQAGSNFNYGGSTLETMRRVAALHAAAFFAPDAVERRRVHSAAAAALEGGVLVGSVSRGGAVGSVSRERFSSSTGGEGVLTTRRSGSAVIFEVEVVGSDSDGGGG